MSWVSLQYKAYYFGVCIGASDFLEIMGEFSKIRGCNIDLK